MTVHANKSFYGNGQILKRTVKPLHSGHSVKQPPTQVACDLMAYICTSIEQRPLYYSRKFVARRRPLWRGFTVLGGGSS